MKNVIMIASAITLLSPEIANCTLDVSLDKNCYQMDIDGVVSFMPKAIVCSCYPRNLICIDGDVYGVYIISGANISIGVRSVLRSICIPSNVDTIDDRCFYSCSNLSNVTFEYGSQLQTISELTFYNCHFLRSIWLPSSVERIGEGCFNECLSLSRVTFGPGSKLRAIENYAFNSCSSLKSIWLPSSVERIGEGCFNECPSLSSITFELN
ncbi:MAG: leucine-rich repeat domain-containing protein [Holosporales bacterium]|jgi:hypothetical protein|nr:leucine-rich repeat domain-containing protein [Holosporales bacterium]